MTTDRTELITQAQAALQDVIWLGRLRFEVLARHFGLTTSQASALLFIDRNGPETTMTECAAALQLPASSITSIVTRLVELGLVQRGMRTDDRRVVSATLTDAGADLVRTIAAQRRDSFSSLLADVADAEIVQFSAVLESIRRAMTSRPAIAAQGNLTGTQNGDDRTIVPSEI